MKKEIEIIVPETWSDVTLATYQNYHKNVSGLEDEDEIVLNTISTLCNVPVDIVSRLKLNDIKTIYKKLSKIISVPVNKEIYEKIEIKGVKYGFHPNIDEMSLGEFVDLEEQTKDGIENMHNVFAILYRPITEEKGNKYDIEPYNAKHIQQSRIFKDVSIDVVNGVMVFFYRLGSKCLTSSKHFLDKNLTSHLQEVSTGGSQL